MEGRNPKAEIRKKAEIRNPKFEGVSKRVHKPQLPNFDGTQYRCSFLRGADVEAGEAMGSCEDPDPGEVLAGGLVFCGDFTGRETNK